MRSLRLIFLAVMAALVWPTAAAADLGDLDTTWGNPANDFDPAGLVLPLAAAKEEGVLIDVVPAGGGALYALYEDTGHEVVKLTASGALDTSWGGGDGRVTVHDTTDAAGWSIDMNALTVASDGAIMVGGSRVDFGTTTSSQIAVVRIDASGVRDMAFAGDGMTNLEGDFPYWTGEDIAAFGDGGVVVGGQMLISTSDGTTFGSSYRMGAVAVTASGVPSTTFKTYARDGLGVSDLEGYGRAIDVERTGAGAERVVVAGYTHTGSGDVWAVQRFDGDGSLDTSFGEDTNADPDVTARRGYVRGAATGRLNDVKVVGSSIYVGGSVADATDASYVWSVGRLNGLGEFDTTFSGDGVATPRLAHLGDTATGTAGEVSRIAVEPGGAVYAMGAAPTTPAQSARGIGVVRLEADGSTDAAYRGGGAGVLHDASEWPGGLLQQPDGRIVVTGATYAPYPPDTSGYALRPTVMRLTKDRTAPTNDAPPRLSQDLLKHGDTVTVSDGEWSGYGTITYEYTWQRCAQEHVPTTAAADLDDADCSAIGDTDNVRTLAAADVDKYVRVIVTAVNDAGMESRAASWATRVSAIAPTSDGQPTVLPNRAVSVGETLEVTDPNFSESPARYSYQWMRCPEANPSTTSNPCQYLPSTAATHTTTAEDAGQHMRVYIVASNSAGSAHSYSSTREVRSEGATGVAPVKTADPVIAPDGAVTEGETLTMVSPGSFTGDPAPALTRQWQRCGGTAAAPESCAGISGASGETYVTTGADAGRIVRLRVLADNGAGSATGVSTGREVREKPAAPRPERPAPTSGGGGAPAGPRPVNTTNVTKMPRVVGRTADEAVELISRAGIFADVQVDAQARRKPLKLKGKALDPGQVHSQSTSAGTPVTSSITGKHRVRLVVEAGPKGMKACQDAEFRRELKGIDLEETWALLEEKGCQKKVNLNFKVAGSADEPEVRSASKDGRELRVTVIVPKSAAEYDLFPTIGQGARLGDPQPSFGVDDWALTAGVDNVFGVAVWDRYLGDGVTSTGSRANIGAQVYVDGDAVGMEDTVRRTREDTGNMAIFGRFHPDKAGTVRYLVQMEDAVGNKIFGSGAFPVKRRSGRFTTIAGETYKVTAGRASRVARGAGAPIARAASAAKLWNWMQGLVAGSPLQSLTRGASSAVEGLMSMAKQAAGPVQFTLGQIASAHARLIQMQAANVVASGGANVVAAGGANVVAAGGANVVAAGGANVVAAGGANVVAAGGGNVMGKERVMNGTGSMRAIPDAALIERGGGVDGVGLSGASKVIAPGGANVVAAGGLNLIGAAAGN